MNKIIRSMFHGSMRTKAYLWSIFILGLIGLVGLLFAIVLGLPQLGVGAVMAGIVAGILTQSIQLEDKAVPKKKKAPKEKKKKLRITSDVTWEESEVISPNYANTDLDDAFEMQADNELADLEELTGDHKLSPKEKERLKSQFLASLNQKQMKKLMKQNRVSSTHRKLMIDSFPDRKMKQVPAFVWRTSDKLNFLVLEGRANGFSIPIRNIKGIYYEKNAEANQEQEYIPFKYNNYAAKMFIDYLPEYSQSTADGKLIYTKNLFRIEPGIYVTNTSMANLMELLPNVPFKINDEVIRSTKFDEYFKELYRFSVLCKNNVMSVERYRELSDNTLEDLLKAPMSGTNFVASLKNMARYRLITQEQMAICGQKYRMLHGKK